MDVVDTYAAQPDRKWVYTQGRNVDEAVAEAAQRLGVSEDELDIEVLGRPRSRVLGFLGLERAMVKASLKRSKIRRICDVVEKLLDLLGIEPAAVQTNSAGDTIEVRIEPGRDAGLIIGKNGVTLDALEHIVQKVARFGWGYRGSVTLDVQGYKERRRQQWAPKIHRAIKGLDRGINPAIVGPFPKTDQRDVVHALNGHDKNHWQLVGRGFYRVVVLHSNRSA